MPAIRCKWPTPPEAGGWGPRRDVAVTPLSHSLPRLNGIRSFGLGLCGPAFLPNPVLEFLMKQIAILISSVLSASLAHANAPVLLDFETPTSFASIAEYYHGGMDSAGATGPALGVSFGLDALTVRNDDGAAPVGGYFSHAPSPVGALAPVGADATMNVAAGFVDSISFHYSSTAFVAQGVNVYAGLGATGDLLASFNLVGNAQRGCNDTPFCRFDRLSSTFAGVAHSVYFGNAAGLAGFDNISITAVPEPQTYAMLMAGLLALGFMVRRRPS